MKNLTAINKANERAIDMMMGKAMCSFANLKQTLDGSWDDTNAQDVAIAAHRSEYEATVRILEFFVAENIYEIQHIVVDNAVEQFGIK